MDNASDKLDLISNMIEEYREDNDILLSTNKFFNKLIDIINDREIIMPPKKELEHIIISCDASIKQNPGGPASIGYVVQFPTSWQQKNHEMAAIVKANTNNLAEYTAVYMALTTLMDLNNNPKCKIEIRTDSQLVVKQIQGNIACNNEQLKIKRDCIRELIANLPIEVELKWRPRNSTPELEQANFLAQDILQVKRH